MMLCADRKAHSWRDVLLGFTKIGGIDILPYRAAFIGLPASTPGVPSGTAWPRAAPVLARSLVGRKSAAPSAVCERFKSQRQSCAAISTIPRRCRDIKCLRSSEGVSLFRPTSCVCLLLYGANVGEGKDVFSLRPSRYRLERQDHRRGRHRRGGHAKTRAIHY